MHKGRKPLASGQTISKLRTSKSRRTTAAICCARSSLSLRCVLGLRHILLREYAAQNVWYPQFARCHAKSKIARKYVHVFAGKGKTGKPKNQKRNWKKRPGQKPLLFGKDSAFFVSLDSPGVSLSILRNQPSPFLLNVYSRQESAWEKTKNKYK